MISSRSNSGTWQPIRKYHYHQKYFSVITFFAYTSSEFQENRMVVMGLDIGVRLTPVSERVHDHSTITPIKNLSGIKHSLPGYKGILIKIFYQRQCHVSCKLQLTTAWVAISVEHSIHPKNVSTNFLGDFNPRFSKGFHATSIHRLNRFM